MIIHSLCMILICMHDLKKCTNIQYFKCNCIMEIQQTVWNVCNHSVNILELRFFKAVDRRTSIDDDRKLAKNRLLIMLVPTISSIKYCVRIVHKYFLYTLTSVTIITFICIVIVGQFW